MNTQDKETRRIVPEHNEGMNVKNTSSEEKKNKENLLKATATFTGAGVVGAAASVATNAVTDDSEPFQEQEIPADDSHNTTSAAQQENSTKQPTNTKHSSQSHLQEPSREDTSFYKENEVKIERIDSDVDSQGNIHHIASGTVNGHEASFVDDGNGKVVAHAVDLNDNHQFEDNEIMESGHDGVTMGNLAEHMVDGDVAPTVPGAESTLVSDVQVIAVENNVDMGDGMIVDAATVIVGKEEALLVDITQNGEIDIVACDSNHDGELGLDEMDVVTDEHIPMPMADEMSDELSGGIVADGGNLPDYSNDSDITFYDI